MQTAMKNASDDEKMILCEEANEVYQACLKTVSRNVANDHILCMLIDEIDHPDKSKYDIKSARHLLFASLLYEDSRRLLSKLKTVEDYAPYDLIRVEPEQPDKPTEPEQPETPDKPDDKPNEDKPSAEQQEMQIRAQRNSLLTLCDWTQLPDAPLTTEQKQEWAEYHPLPPDGLLQCRYCA